MKNKPHIWRHSHTTRFVDSVWWCADGKWLGWGHTPFAAYVNWKSRNGYNNCIHQRANPLQQRRGVQL